MTSASPDLSAAPDRRRQFEALVREYEAPLLRYAARIVLDNDAAQDVVQQTFINLLHHWRGAWQAGADLSNWLYRVAHNCAVDYLRREARRRRLHERHAEEQPDAAPPDRGAAFQVSDAAAAAHEALQRLSLRERQLVILKVYEEKSYKEIGAITGLTVTNVGYILHQAMRKLAQELRKAEQP